MQKRVKELYGELKHAAEKEDFVTVDGGRGFDEVHEEIVRVILDAFEKVEKEAGPLRVVQPW